VLDDGNHDNARAPDGVGRPDEPTWGRFLDRHAAGIRRVIAAMVDDDDERMDLFVAVCDGLRADGMRRVHAYRPRPDAPCRFTTYLAVVVRNLALDQLRARHGRFRPFAIVDGLDPADRLIFDYVLRQGRGADETIALLEGKHGLRIDRDELARRSERLDGMLSRDQRWRLLAGKWGPKRHVPLDESDLGTSSSAGRPERFDPAEALLTQDAGRVLREALAAVPPRQCLALVLRYRDGLDVGRVAVVMSASDHQVERWSRQGARRLRRRLERAGLRRVDFETLDLAAIWPG